MSRFVFDLKDTVYVVVDMQERLAAAMPEDDMRRACNATAVVLQTAKAMNIPVITLRQYPKGLGDVMKELKVFLPEEYIDKTCFSGFGEKTFAERVSELGKKNVIISGMETHVCVLQTAVDFSAGGYNVQVIADACVSRTKDNWSYGLDFMKQAGCVISCSETLVFQLIKGSTHENFKLVSKLVK